ncbi:hypothetical protein L9H26_08755 [Morganella psychrotolerans]|uniref:Uncharacterized protein n=1 Tax=Morganella psychrotolerans TaxID=368603 RepID=A0A5M9R7E1_9GAMM|nr:hypothetical protein [Morganella psychrotolerans]KAA8716610.1 hypothetical protein F4V73_01600 [Morganella psychrotolerans]
MALLISYQANKDVVIMFKLKKSILIICSLLFSMSSFASESNVGETRKATQAMVVNVINNMETKLHLYSKELIYGRWGDEPSNEIAQANKDRYYTKGVALTGPEAKVNYTFLSNGGEELYFSIHTNVDHYYPKEPTIRACLSDREDYTSASRCVVLVKSVIEGTASFGGIQIKAIKTWSSSNSQEHDYDVFIKSHDGMKLKKSLCNIDKTNILEKQYIKSIMAVSHFNNKDEYPHKVTLADGRTFNMHKNSEGVLDLVTSAYHSSMYIDICQYQNTNNIQSVYIHK